MRKSFLVASLVLAVSMTAGTAIFETTIAEAQNAEQKSAEQKNQVNKGNVEKGLAIFTTQCAACHGNTGKGDGAAAVALEPKPRDLSEAKYMASLTNDYLVKLLRGGGAAVGKSPNMPALGAAMTPEQIADVIAYIRTLSSTKKATETVKQAPAAAPGSGK